MGRPDKWREYEQGKRALQEKAKLAALKMPPKAYEKALRRLAERLKV